MAGCTGVAGGSWVVAIDQMRGMDAGVATNLGSMGTFAAAWVSMMAAMMLPGAIPAVLRQAGDSRRWLASSLFAVQYLAIWALTGAVVYALGRPHGTAGAGVVVLAAGIYEMTPLKRYFRNRCRGSARSGLVFGLDCVGSSIGLMAVLVAVGIMSIPWMAVTAVVVTAQKVLPARPSIDVALALAITGLGIVILFAPSSFPGLMPSSVPPPRN